MNDRRDSGFSLVEVLVVSTLTAMLVFTAWPALVAGTARLRTETAAAELSGVLRRARSLAVAHNVNVGVKFFVDPERTLFAIYRDGDGDGVSSADIADGTDRPLAGRRSLRHFDAHTGFGFPPGPPPPDPGDPGRSLTRLDDPIRLNRSDIAAFSQLGSGTPGSLYVTDGARALAVVRIAGATGRVRTLSYDPHERVWR